MHLRLFYAIKVYLLTYLLTYRDGWRQFSWCQGRLVYII